MATRQAQIKRETRETRISVSITIDGTGQASNATRVGFLDHMLDLFARHGLFDLKVEATGDTQVDAHHTVEDVGICLGQALARALGDRCGIRRFGDRVVPMEDSLAQIALDLSGRGSLVCNVVFPTEKTGDFDVQLVEEFLGAFASNAGMNLHVNLLYGKNSHHIAEAIFKGLAKALDDATQVDPSDSGVPSTKGIL